MMMTDLENGVLEYPVILNSAYEWCRNPTGTCIKCSHLPETYLGLSKPLPRTKQTASQGQNSSGSDKRQQEGRTHLLYL